MALEVGNIVEGKVTGLAKFGVFVELGDKKVGLVHISEVASEYVSDVNDYLKINDKVKVKILSVDDKGKIALSIKQVPSGDFQEKKREHFKKD
ncbi:MAG: S1 RNA-binding domain-containing protein, partial [Dialister sp.]|nr:S1 RNA-binding domain-containing protein [Dialister sp.]